MYTNVHMCTRQFVARAGGGEIVFNPIPINATT